MQRPDGSLILAERHGVALERYHVDQGDTDDCGPHVVAMAVNFWHGDSILVVEDVAREMNRPRLRRGLLPLVVRRIPNWATFPWGIVDMLGRHGVPARWRTGAGEADLGRALREDRLALPVFGEPLRRRGWRWTGWAHIAIISGWDPQKDTYWFVDSSQGTVPFGRPADEVLALWRNLRGLLVETL